MANPRIEEVDDASDPDEMDLEAFDFARPQQGSLSTAEQQAMAASQSQISHSELERILSPDGVGGGGHVPELQRPSATMNERERERVQREQYERTRGFQCVYPIYFDASRSREQGRRVSKEDAVTNPLAREIVDALQHIGKTTGTPLQIAFEPTKTHPKDWANPGRVRVLIKKDGRAVSSKLSNSTSFGFQSS